MTAQLITLDTARTDPIEGRRDQRRRCFKAGRITLHGAFSTFDVTIKDISANGARLKLTTPWIVPQTFELVILNPNTGMLERKACEKRWQKSINVGVMFLEEIPEDTDDVKTLFSFS